MKTWVDSLRIAIVEEDMEKLVALSEDIPKTDDVELAQEACALIEEAVKLATEKKTLLSLELSKLKAAQRYLR